MTSVTGTCHISAWLNWNKIRPVFLVHMGVRMKYASRLADVRRARRGRKLPCPTWDNDINSEETEIGKRCKRN